MLLNRLILYVEDEVGYICKMTYNVLGFNWVLTCPFCKLSVQDGYNSFGELFFKLFLKKGNISTLFFFSIFFPYLSQKSNRTCYPLFSSIFSFFSPNKFLASFVCLIYTSILFKYTDIFSYRLTQVQTCPFRPRSPFRPSEFTLTTDSMTRRALTTDLTTRRLPRRRTGPPTTTVSPRGWLYGKAATSELRLMSERLNTSSQRISSITSSLYRKYSWRSFI